VELKVPVDLMAQAAALAVAAVTMADLQPEAVALELLDKVITVEAVPQFQELELAVEVEVRELLEEILEPVAMLVMLVWAVMDQQTQFLALHQVN
jgi:hypothetical protein